MLEKTYDPRAVEASLYTQWEALGLFRPEVHADATALFSMVIPPPNVTGTLHMGHALDSTLQDILARWHRMRGEATLWMPGMDHAGIATQNVVERQLRADGLNKDDLGREKFIETVWEWADARKQDITNQFRRLGISPDWSRQRFTLDDGLSQAVRRAFVTLYDQGLIYKGTYIVNWCPRCTSAISDIETEYVEEESFLWEISYALKDLPGAIVVATTRPETMFGDVAVAVNPDDSRYKDLIGKTVILPLANREIPIIADAQVQADFGTGALKITPAHDPNDFEIATRHGLAPVWVMDEQGKMKSDETVPEALHGLDGQAARIETENMLQLHGFLISKVPHTHNVGHCQRCGTTIEPLLSQQWFVRCKPLAERCLQSLAAREVRFIPERWTKVYVDWMENIRDWCISRQLWWGHQIPAWTCANEHLTVAIETPTACAQCQDTHLVQETDVLDTWFSSGLWPFSTMGWPDLQAPDFQRFYPTNVLVTGFDIIFFWVARMTMLGLALTEQSPFETVYIHGLIRDEKGQKMSKSKGNTIDPVEIIDAYGCDALRYALTSLVTYGGQDIKLSTASFEQGKLFANKLWNASRFVLMNLEGVDAQPIDTTLLTDFDRWMLARLAQTAASVNVHLAAFRFSEATDVLYEFIWNAFCDWYVEYAKKQLRDPATKANTQRVLLHGLDTILRLLHPVMPTITEAIWLQLPHRTAPSISIGPFPTADMPIDESIITAVDGVIETIRTIRNVRQTSNIPVGHAVPVTIEAIDPSLRTSLKANQATLFHFLKLDTLTIQPEVTDPPAQAAVGVMSGGRVFVSLVGAIDVAVERARQDKKRETLQKEHLQLTTMLNNPGFTDRAPAAVVTKNRTRLAELDHQIAVIEAQLQQLAEF